MTRHQDFDTLLRSLDAAGSASPADTGRARADLQRILATEPKPEHTPPVRVLPALSALSESRNNRPSAVHSESTTTPFPTKAGPKHFRRRIVLASAAAAFLVGAIVAADVVLPGRPGATAEAAEVLNKAAAATIETSDPVVGPGQYLKIETTGLGGTSTTAANGSHVSWVQKTREQLYVPADRNGEWVWNREESVPIDFSNEAAKAVEVEIRKARPTEGVPLLVGVLRAQKGAFYGAGTEPTVIIGTPLSEAGSLPRDPQALLDLIQKRTKGAGKSAEMEAFVTIADGLRNGALPADLRAALYEAAALITGVTVADKQATVDGRTGIAIGIPSPDGGVRQDIIIDPTSGLLIGEQAVLLKDYPDEPAGTVVHWTSIRTSVVDSAP